MATGRPRRPSLVVVEEASAQAGRRPEFNADLPPRRRSSLTQSRTISPAVDQLGSSQGSDTVPGAQGRRSSSTGSSAAAVTGNAVAGQWNQSRRASPSDIQISRKTGGEELSSMGASASVVPVRSPVNRKHRPTAQSFVPVEDVTDPDFARSYMEGSLYGDRVQAAEDATKEKRKRRDAENNPELTRTLEEHIKHPRDSTLGWRDAGSFVCMQATPPETHGFSPYYLEFSSSGKYLASCGHDGSVKVWDPRSLELLKVFHGHKGIVTQCGFTADEKYAVSVDSTNLMVWYMDAPKGVSTAKFIIAGLEAASCFALASDNSTMVISGASAQLAIWNFASALEYSTLKDTRQMVNDFRTHCLPEEGQAGHSDKVTRTAFAPNNCHLLSCSYDKTIMLWDVRKRKGGPLQTFKGHNDHVLGLCWHSSGRMFTSCGHDRKVLVWRLDLHVPIHILEDHESVVYSCAYLPDSNRLLTLSNDSELIMYNTRHGGVQARLEHVQKGARPCLAVDPNTGTRFAVAATDKMRPITIWEVERPEPCSHTLLKCLCSWLPWLLTYAKNLIEPPERNRGNLHRMVDADGKFRTWKKEDE